MSVAQRQRAERAHVIDVALAVRIPDIGPTAPDHDGGLSSDRPVCTHRTVDAARENLLSPLAPGCDVALASGALTGLHRARSSQRS